MRVAVIHVDQYDSGSTSLVQIPDGLGLEVLRAWLLDEFAVVAVFRGDPEFIDERGLEKPSKGWFKKEHRETAMHMMKRP